MAIQNPLYLYLNLDKVFRAHVKVNLMECSLRSFATSVYKVTKHLGLIFANDAPKIWNDLPDDVRLATSLHSLCTSIPTLISAFPSTLSVALTPAMSQFNDYSSLLFFCLVRLESVFRWR